MLEEVVTFEPVPKWETGHIEVRRVSRILKDGVEISRSYHRHVLSPGDNLTGQDSRTVATAHMVWTPECVAAYQATMKATSAIAPAKASAEPKVSQY